MSQTGEAASNVRYDREMLALAKERGEVLVTVDFNRHTVKGPRVTFQGPWPKEAEAELWNLFWAWYQKHVKKKPRKPAKASAKKAKTSR
jgi:hypothetical protein